MLTAPSTVADLLRSRAIDSPDDLAYVFLADGESEEQSISYRELDLRARSLAANLSTNANVGDRALLLFPPGLDYVVAFLGCLYARVVAVPAYPPQSPRGLERIAAIVADSGATTALTTSDVLAMGRSALGGRLRWVATDEVTDEPIGGPAAEPDGLAFLQYTSGSTRTPRGVMLTHANLMHNLSTIHGCFAADSGDVLVSWLPPYHDMGLIGAILEPLFGGFPAVLMSPLHFLQRPARWLEAISRYRATISPAPNFAYELCLRKMNEAQRAAVDLSTWRVAINGAEPVRAETVERFTAGFAAAGLPPTALRPCYGLAEATLLVTTDPVGTPARTPVVDGVTRVDCGPVQGGQDLVIVDQVSLTALPPGEQGEVWLSGPSVASGYWGRPTETEALFRARLADGRGPYLRTGDLGRLDVDGGLIVGGRIKDLIILTGRNHYPQDIEQAVEESHPAVRAGCSAAFGVPVDGQERLVVVAELADGGQPDEVITAARRAVAERCEAELYELVLVAPRTVPKTSSGKIQRAASRTAYERATLDKVGGWRAAPAAEGADLTTPRTPVEAVIAGLWADLLGVAQVGVHDDFLAAGGQSLLLTQLASRIEAELPVRVTIGDIFEAPTVAKLADLLSRRPLFVPDDQVLDLITRHDG